MAIPYRKRSPYLLLFLNAIVSHWIPVVFGPLLVGAITYGALVLYPYYTSVTLLEIDQEKANTATSIMHTSAFADAVLPKYSDVGDNSEQRKRYLQRNLRIVPATAGRTPTVHELQVSHHDPAVAQQLANDVLARWLELSKPRPVKRAQLEADLARYQAQIEELTGLIGRLGNETKVLVYPNTLSGEIATPLHALYTKRDEASRAVAKIKEQLDGITRDAIVVPPSLPTERAYSAGWPALLAAAITLLIMLAFTGLWWVMIPQWRLKLAAFKKQEITKYLGPFPEEMGLKNSSDRQRQG